MAAPSWESKGADFSDTSATPTFPVPVGATIGKVTIVTMFVNGGATLISSTPLGFAAVPGSPVIASNHRQYRYWKRLTGSDVGTYDFILDTSVFVEGAAELFNTVKESGNPFDPNPGTAVSEINASTSPEVSTESMGPDRLILHSATCWSGGIWTPDQVGYNKRIETPVGLVTTSDKTQAVAGLTSSVTSTTTTSDKRTAHVVALIGTTVAGGSMVSISDEARTNMLSNRALAEPQLLSNVDLMRLVLADAGQVLVPKTNATVAEHYNRYLITMRDT